MADPQTTYRVQRTTGRDPVAARRSIMFSERLSLAVLDDGGAVTTELLTIGANGPTVGRVTSTGHEIVLREADSLTFLLPRSGSLGIRIGDTDYELRTGQPIAFRPSERRTRARPDAVGRFAAATLQVPMVRLRELAQAVGTAADRTFARDGMDLTGEVGQFLVRALPRLADDLFLRPSPTLPARVAQEIGCLIDEQLCELIGMIAARTAARPVFPAFHRVRQAEALMHAQSDEPLSILDIATSLGVGLRSLQLAFQEVHGGLSPRDLLIRIRLEKARQRLLAAGEEGNVTTVAMDSGFFHLGRFAQAYGRTFGERPSETLARRRA